MHIALLNRILHHAHQENLRSGFRAAGIEALDRQLMLKGLLVGKKKTCVKILTLATTEFQENKNKETQFMEQETTEETEI